MRKCKLALFGVAIFASVLLTSCSENSNDLYPLKEIESDLSTTIFYDQETKVMYVS